MNEAKRNECMLDPVVRRIKPCPVGTLVSYRRVDGTCHTVENMKHAWCHDGTCGNCDMTREEAGYSVTRRELEERKHTAERRRQHRERRAANH